MARSSGRAQKTFSVDNTRITLDVDRNLVMTGDTVTATLHAIRAAAPGGDRSLDLLQTNNYEGERVEQPADRDRSREARVDRVARRRPHGARRTSGSARAGEARADRFVHGLHHAARSQAEKSEYIFEQKLGLRGRVEAGNAAAISIMGWSGNSLAVKVVAETPLTSTTPFSLAVHVKNTTGRNLKAMPYATLAHRRQRRRLPRHGCDAIHDRLARRRIRSGVDRRGPRGLARSKEAVERFLVTPHDPNASSSRSRSRPSRPTMRRDRSPPVRWMS